MLINVQHLNDDFSEGRNGRRVIRRCQDRYGVYVARFAIQRLRQVNLSAFVDGKVLRYIRRVIVRIGIVGRRNDAVAQVLSADGLDTCYGRSCHAKRIFRVSRLSPL